MVCTYTQKNIDIFIQFFHIFNDILCNRIIYNIVSLNVHKIFFTGFLFYLNIGKKIFFSQVVVDVGHEVVLLEEQRPR